MKKKQVSEKSQSKIIPYVLIHIHNTVEMLNYSQILH